MSGEEPFKLTPIKHVLNGLPPKMQAGDSEWANSDLGDFAGKKQPALARLAIQGKNGAGHVLEAGVVVSPMPCRTTGLSLSRKETAKLVSLRMAFVRIHSSKVEW